MVASGQAWIDKLLLCIFLTKQTQTVKQVQQQQQQTNASNYNYYIWWTALSIVWSVVVVWTLQDAIAILLWFT